MTNDTHIINKETLISLTEDWAGGKAAEPVRLPGSGSDRIYYRLTTEDRRTAIGVIGNNVAENRSFISLARYFADEGIAMPHIYGVAEGGGAYLQEDLGDTSLFSLIGTQDAPGLVAECMKSLAHMQTLPVAEWQDCCFCGPFDRRQAMWDLNYFKYEYLKPSGAVFDEDRLEDDFETLAAALVSYPKSLEGFMYRDCQSRNVMVRDGKPYWIDFQGGRVGPCVYDAVSFLWQAKAGFNSEFRRRMLSVYAAEFAALRGIADRKVLEAVPVFVLFRTLQVLGAYGFRGLVQHRAHFVESIPGALANLRELIASGAVDAYPELKRVCEILVNDNRFVRDSGRAGLTVEVFSFSYKRGYPADYSGNGGGFMFDCRALHNPGRYDEYKLLTGLDKPVRDFLEEHGEIQPFLASAWELTDAAVECYRRRGFTSLQIGYGCTGGRHRSVYSADATARHIAAKYPDVRVIVNHREQEIREEVKA